MLQMLRNNLKTKMHGYAALKRTRKNSETLNSLLQETNEEDEKDGYRQRNVRQFLQSA